MKKLLVSLVIVSFIFSFLASSIEAVTRTKGYTKKNGTYVAPSYKSTPNKSKLDNFSTKGNINPYTGKKGTVDHFKTTPKKHK